MYILGI